MPRLRSRPLFALACGSCLLGASLLGCSDDPDPDPTDQPDAGAVLLEPPAPGEGLQLQMSTTIPAGVEGERCRFVIASADDLWVIRDQVRFTQGSHHFLLYETSYDSIPTMRDDGVAVDTSGVFDCSDGATNGWSVTKLVGGSQNGEGESMLAFPAGVAMPVRAGAVLLMNAHYVNASPQEIRINLYTIPESEVTTEGDLLFLYNPLIAVPGHGTARARWRCPVHTDITIANLQSHMHVRGVGYQAAADDGAPFYENDQWENVPVKRFEPGLQVAAGSTLDYHCDYENGEDREVFQGPRSTDEMCMLIGSYYPADPRTANCLDETGERLAGEWIGNGTATCAATLDCIGAALQSGADDPLRPLTTCMLSAKPDVSREASAYFRCLIYAADPQTECAAEITACQAR
jgi:hypothetical protein